MGEELRRTVSGAAVVKATKGVATEEERDAGGSVPAGLMSKLSPPHLFQWRDPGIARVG